MGLWDRLAALELTVSGHRSERLERVVATSAFRRVTTLVVLFGDGEEGVGEDVTVDALDHDVRPHAGGLAALAGRHTLGSFAQKLDELELWPRQPAMAVAHRYRRWAYESAALDLALRQAGVAVGDALEREPRPMSFVASFRLGDPPAFDAVRRRLDRYPDLRLKLDPTRAWTGELTERIAATGAVETIDLKGVARGTAVDQEPDAGLYGRVADAFRTAWIEDPGLTPATERTLAPHWGRITWDAPILGPDDVRRLAVRPPHVNVKPARVGTLRALLDLYEHCEEHRIGMYAGGQFELGPGRAQIQRLASLFHPDAPNDAAPSGYNEPVPPPGLPVSPLPVAPSRPGFR